MTVGQRLRKARLKLNLRQLDIADKLGCTQPTIHAWESDATLPRTEDIRDVAAAYGLDPEHLLPKSA